MTKSEIQSYRDLVVWQKAIALSVACYHLTKEFPKDEMYGMVAPIRRASVSIAANIAEGHGRGHTRSFIQFRRISQGSLKELESHHILAESVRLVGRDKVEPMLKSADEIGRMLRGLIRTLQAKIGEDDRQ